MKNYTIDLRDVYNMDDLQKTLVRELPLPAYYGNNLDALHDEMTEWTEQIRIDFQHVGQAEVMMPRYMKALRRLCRDVQEECSNIEIQFQE